MNKIILPDPQTITFVSTNYCTSKCYNCCFQCSPQKKEKLTIDEMQDYLDQAKNSFPSLKLMVITGGESFTFGNKLTRLIKYASEKHNIIEGPIIDKPIKDTFS